MQIVDVGRDQKTPTYPTGAGGGCAPFTRSKYARNVKCKIDFTRDHLAGQEMEMGRFYLKRKRISGGDEPLQTGIDHYQVTIEVPEARLVECDL
jgi:outer membrane protein assembly factor BamD